MAKIFISYDRGSKDVVEQLVQDLRDDGQEVWYDQHLTGGQKWWDNILSEIRACEIFVAALTPASLESRACQREAKHAEDLQRILLPVRLSDEVLPDSLPPELSELQWVDYSRLDKQALKSLQRTLRNVPKAPPLPDPLPDAPPVPISYMSSLRARIETESRLEDKDQFALVFQFRRHFRDGRPAEEINELLQRLKKRDDLLATVVREIEELQGEINRGKSTTVRVEKADQVLPEPPVVPAITPPRPWTSVGLMGNGGSGKGASGSGEHKKPILGLLFGPYPLSPTVGLFVRLVLAVGCFFLVAFFDSYPHKNYSLSSGSSVLGFLLSLSAVYNFWKIKTRHTRSVLFHVMVWSALVFALLIGYLHAYILVFVLKKPGF